MPRTRPRGAPPGAREPDEGRGARRARRDDRAGRGRPGCVDRLPAGDLLRPYFCAQQEPKWFAPAELDTEDEVLVADLELELIDDVRTTWQFFRERRPETDGELAELLP